MPVPCAAILISREKDAFAPAMLAPLLFKPILGWITGRLSPRAC
jgi:hypothetical protein